MAPRTRRPDLDCAAAPGLTWVLADGRLRHVSSFAGLRPALRPAARCPACDAPVTLKLGPVRAHHAAHRPGDECAASRPESVLHLNAKCLLAARLRDAIGRGHPLRVAEPCVAGRAHERPAGGDAGEHPAWERWGTECTETGVHDWITGWDDVAIEHAVHDDRERRRPDVVLRRDGRVIAAIEVRHTHRVDADRARALAALDVPWVEVVADARLADEEWTCERPLPVVARGPGAPWRCDRHRTMHAAWLADRAREAGMRLAHPERFERIVAARLADVLYPTGGSTRLLYTMERGASGDASRAVLLRRDRQLLGEFPFDTADPPAGVHLSGVDAAVRDDLRRIAAGHRAIVDSPMGWATGVAARATAEPFDADDWAALERTHPRRWRWAPAQGRWFQPPDLAGVTWDRPADAPELAVHPAAARARAPRHARRPPAPGTHDPLVVAARRAPPTRYDPAATPTPGLPVTPAAPSPRLVSEPRPRAAARRLDPAALGPCLVEVEALPWATIYRLAEAPGGRATERVLAVPSGPVAPGEVLRIDRSLLAAGRQRLWLSHRAHWTRDLAALPWVPIFRHAAGEVMASFRGRTMRLSDLVAAFARADRRFRPESLAKGNAAERLPY